jgi:hypothetical protein
METSVKGLLSFVNFHACELDISPQGTPKRVRLITALREGINYNCVAGLSIDDEVSNEPDSCCR